MRSRRRVLQNILNAACTALMLSPYALLPQDARERLAFALQRPTSLDLRVIADLGSITNSYWRARAHGGVFPELLSGATGHFQSVISLLKRSHSIGAQRELYALARDIAQFIGFLLFDMRDSATAWSYYHFAQSAAQHVGKVEGEAAVLARISFLFTYSQQSGSTPSPEALTFLERAQYLTARSTEHSLRARLSAIKAEVHVNLGQVDACQRELDLSEELVINQDDQYEAVPDTINSFDRAAFLGYKGACLIRMEKPLDALAALCEGHKLQGGGERIHDVVLLTDLAAAHAKLGEYKKSCALINEALPLITQIQSSNHFFRVSQLRDNLQPWAYTSDVKELDYCLEQVRKILTGGNG